MATMNRQDDDTFLSKGSEMSEQTEPTPPKPVAKKIDHSRDYEFRREFKAGSYQMTEDQYVSLRRCECGLEDFT